MGHLTTSAPGVSSKSECGSQGTLLVSCQKETVFELRMVLSSGPIDVTVRIQKYNLAKQIKCFLINYDMQLLCTRKEVKN